MNEQEPLPYNFKDFDPYNDLKDVKNFSCAMFAKRRSGKTVLLKYMLSKIHKWYETSYAFCETLDVQENMFDYVPEENRFMTFDVAKLDEIYTRQKERIQKLCDEKGEENKHKFPHILIVFDDFINDPLVRTSKEFTKLATLGRHSNIAFICLSQCVGGRHGLPKSVRGNMDIIISFLVESEYDRKLIVEQFLSINSKKEGEAILREITSPTHQALIILNFKKTFDYNELIRKCTADLKTPSFFIGNKKYSNAKTPAYVKDKSPWQLYQYFDANTELSKPLYGKSTRK